MTKKDYELAAHEINQYLVREEQNQALKVPNEIFNTWVDIFCVVFERDNPSFNRDKFKEACYTGKHIRKTIKGEC